MKSLKALLLVCFLWNGLSSILGQCPIELGENCESAPTVWAHSLINFACQNTSNQPSPCQPLCSQGGVGHNTSWINIQGLSGVVKFTIDIGACTSSQGLQWGVWADCNCSQEIFAQAIPCIPPMSKSTISATFDPAKTYNLWIDGCSGDVCDFTISLDVAPCINKDTTLESFYINSDPDGQLNPVCQGACQILLDAGVSNLGNNLEYHWRIGNHEFYNNSSSMLYDFPDLGLHEICVSVAFNKGPYCYKSQTTCSTIDVIPNEKRSNQIKSICQEVIDKGGRTKNCIFLPDKSYYCIYNLANCCYIEETGTYSIKPSPNPGIIHFIGCQGETYVDPLGIAYKDCTLQKLINIPFGYLNSDCDSNIILTAIFPKFEHAISFSCKDGMSEINPNFKTTGSTCGAGESYSYEYTWFWLDSLRMPISHNEILRTNRFGSFVLEIQITIRLGTETRICVYNINYSIPNPMIQKGFDPGVVNCTGIIQSYCAEKSVPYYSSYKWIIDTCGTIINASLDSSCILVAWKESSCKNTAICLEYSGGTSCIKKCKVVELESFDPNKQVDFKLSTSTVCPGKFVQLSDLSSCIYTHRSWELYHKQKLIYKTELLNPGFRLFKSGYYSIRLIASNNIKSTEIWKQNVLKVSSEFCSLTKDSPKDTLGERKLIKSIRKADDLISMKAWPNPCNDKLKLFWEADQQNTGQVVIRNLNGVQMLAFQINGAQRFELNTLTLQPGIYLLELNYLNAREFIKIVVL